MVLHWGLGVLGSLLTLRERVPWRGSRWCLGRGEKETAGLGRGLALQCALVALKPSCTGRSTRQHNHCAAATPGAGFLPKVPPRQHPLLCPTIVCPPRRTCAPAQTFIPMHRLRCQLPSAPEILHLRALCARSRASCAWTAHPAVPSRLHLGPGSPAGVCRHRLADDGRIRRRIRK